MDPYSGPYIIPNNSLHNPFPHSLLSTRQSSRGWLRCSVVEGFGVPLSGFKVLGS